MYIKTNLHFHTKDDPRDNISYSTIEGIDKAAALGFKALALTCHTKYTWTPEYAAYAEKRDITLIPGIESSIGETEEDGRHVVLLNCTPEAEKVRTFQDLEQYKKAYPQVFILAPHPYFPNIGKPFSLMKYTDKYAHLFDAIEHSWFYSKYYNKNPLAAEAAKRHSIPLVSTSDTHFMNFFDTDYCVIEAEDRTPAAIFSALRAGKFKNVTRPKRFLSEFFIPVAFHTFQDHVLHRKPSRK